MSTITSPPIVMDNYEGPPLSQGIRNASLSDVKVEQKDENVLKIPSNIIQIKQASFFGSPMPDYIVLTSNNQPSQIVPNQEIHVPMSPTLIKIEPEEESAASIETQKMDESAPHPVTIKIEQEESAGADAENIKVSPPLIKLEPQEIPPSPALSMASTVERKYNTGRVIITRKIIRKLFCKICMEPCQTIPKLKVHLDRHHNTRISKEDAPTVLDADDKDDKEKLEDVSRFLQSIENRPRFAQALSDSNESDSSESSSSEDDDYFDILDTEAEGVRLEDLKYRKEKEREAERLVKKEMSWRKDRMEKADNHVILKEVQKFFQCSICFLELPKDQRLSYLAEDHQRQHDQGLYHHCSFCEQPFLLEHQLNVHLEDMRVPTVPSDFPPSEAADLMFKLHPCPIENCDASFVSRKCLLFHRTSKHDRLHRCSTCEKPFIHVAVLRKHIQRCHNWEMREIYCPVDNCDKSFPTIKGISTHLVKSHNYAKEQKDGIIAKLNAEITYKVTKSGQRRTFWSSRLKMEKPRRKMPLGYVSANSKSTSTSNTPNKMSIPKPQGSINRSISQPKWTIKREPEFKITKISKYDQIDSLPPGSNIRTPHFTSICYYCTRTFRNQQDRDQHLGEIHNIDTSLEKPCKCPVKDCEFGCTMSWLMRHIRSNHSEHPSIIQNMQEKGLKEDQEYVAQHGEPKFNRRMSFEVKSDYEDAEDYEPENTTRRGKTNYNGMFSLPPRENAFDLDEKERIIPESKLYPYICPLCTRTFRLQQHKDQHVQDVHNINLKLEKPCKCPVPGCCYKSDLTWIRRHMRNVHSEDPYLTRNFYYKSFEEDQAFVEKYGEPTDGTQIEIKSEIDEEGADGNENRQIPYKRRSTFKSVRKYKRGRPPSGNGNTQSPFAISNGKKIRQALSKFKIGDQLFCPECTSETKRTFYNEWNLLRHFIRSHPKSQLLKNPEQVFTETVSENVKINVEQTEEKSENVEEIEKDNHEEELEEVEPMDEHNQDFIDLSFPFHILSFHRKRLDEFRFHKHDKKVYCPECLKIGKQYSLASTFNLQRHLVSQHGRCELLRRSLLPSDISMPERKHGKAKAPLQKTIFSSRKPRTTKKFDFIKFKLDSGRFFCSECPAETEEELKTFSHDFNLKTHLQTYHPKSKLLFPDPLLFPKSFSPDTPSSSSANKGRKKVYDFSQFKLKSGRFYCPDCPTEKEEELRTFLHSYTFMFHLRKVHPTSKLLAPDASIFTKPFAPKTPSSSTITNRKRIVKPPQRKIIVPSRNFLVSYKELSRFKLKSGLYFCAECPISEKEEELKKFTQPHNLVYHLKKAHPTSKLLGPGASNKSSSIPIIKNRKRIAKPSLQKKIAPSRKQKRRQTYVSYKNLEFSNFKLKSGLFYCAECPISEKEEELKTFTRSFNLVYHLKSAHPNSKLLVPDAPINIKPLSPITTKTTLTPRGGKKIKRYDYSRFKLNSGRFYCSECKVSENEEELRTFSQWFNLLTHLRALHPNSKLLIPNVLLPPATLSLTGPVTPKESKDSAEPESEEELQELPEPEREIKEEIASEEDEEPLFEPIPSTPKQLSDDEMLKYLNNSSIYSLTESGRYQCPQCDKSFTAPWNVNRHENSCHTKAKPITPTFDMMSTEQEALARFKEFNIELDLSKITCPFCSEDLTTKHIYPNIHHLIKHFSRSLRHKGENPINPVPTALSDLRIPQPSTIHPSMVLFTGKVWACGWCPVNWGSKQYLTIHVKKKHRDISDEKYKTYCIELIRTIQTCGLCGYFNKSRKEFMKHFLECRKSQLGYKDESSNSHSPLPQELPSDVETIPQDIPAIQQSSQTPQPSELEEVSSPKKLKESPSKPQSRVLRRRSALFPQQYKDSSDSEEGDGLTLIKRQKLQNFVEVNEPTQTCPECLEEFQTKKALIAHSTWHKRWNAQKRQSQDNYQMNRQEDDEEDSELEEIDPSTMIFVDDQEEILQEIVEPPEGIFPRQDSEHEIPNCSAMATAINTLALGEENP